MHVHDLYIYYSCMCFFGGRAKKESNNFFNQIFRLSCMLCVAPCIHAYLKYSIHTYSCYHMKCIFDFAPMCPVCVFMWTRIWNREQVRKARSIPIGRVIVMCEAKLAKTNNLHSKYLVQKWRKKNTTTNNNRNKTRAKNHVYNIKL